jgi:hypothetical protein
MEKMIDELFSKMLERLVDEFNDKTKKNEMTKENFRPYLDGAGMISGYIGDKTNLIDVNGIELYVGDAVTIYCDNKHIGEAFVLEEKGKFFVVGMAIANFKNGVWESNILGEKNLWKIAKIASYKELKHNDTIGEIKKIKAKLNFEE